jgi:hypothetical protein
MPNAALFNNGQNQAISLTKEYSFERLKEVDLKRTPGQGQFFLRVKAYFKET